MMYYLVTMRSYARLRGLAFLALLVVTGLGVPGKVRANFTTVVIDAGHGGHNLGQAVGGVYEKWMALDTAFRLERYLRDRGMRVVMTRRTDVFISLPDRVKIADQHRRNSIFVSIHYNGASNRGAHGLETFYYGTSGFQLATRVQREIVSAVRGVNRGVKHARFHVIRNTTQPAILVEGGFLTNEAERNRIKTGAYRQAIAEGVGRGIMQYRTDLQRGRAR